MSSIAMVIIALTLGIKPATATFYGLAQSGMGDPCVDAMPTVLIISPNGEYVLVIWNVGTARIWNIQSGAVLDNFQDSEKASMWSAAFSPDSKSVALGTSDGAMVLRDVSTGAMMQTFTHDIDDANPGLIAVVGINFSPDGKSLLTSDTYGGRLWDVRTGKQIFAFPSHDREANDSEETVSFSPNGQYVLVDGHPTLWNAQTGEKIHAFDNYENARFSPDGQYILTLQSANGIALWDAHTYQQIHTFDGYFGKFSPNGRYLYVYTDQAPPSLWDLQTMTKLTTFVDSNDDISAFFPDSEHILVDVTTGYTSQVDTYIVWDIKKGIILRTINISDFATTPLAITDDGSVLLTGSTEKQIRSWDLATGKEILNYCQVQSPKPTA